MPAARQKLQVMPSDDASLEVQRATENGEYRPDTISSVVETFGGMLESGSGHLWKTLHFPHPTIERTDLQFAPGFFEFVSGNQGTLFALSEGKELRNEPGGRRVFFFEETGFQRKLELLLTPSYLFGNAYSLSIKQNDILNVAGMANGSNPDSNTYTILTRMILGQERTRLAIKRIFFDSLRGSMANECASARRALSMTGKGAKLLGDADGLKARYQEFRAEMGCDPCAHAAQHMMIVGNTPGVFTFSQCGGVVFHLFAHDGFEVGGEYGGVRPCNVYLASVTSSSIDCSGYLAVDASDGFPGKARICTLGIRRAPKIAADAVTGCIEEINAAMNCDVTAHQVDSKLGFTIARKIVLDKKELCDKSAIEHSLNGEREQAQKWLLARSAMDVLLKTVSELFVMALRYEGGFKKMVANASGGREEFQNHFWNTCLPRYEKRTREQTRVDHGIIMPERIAG